jgi:hypothetical protein
MKTGNLLVLAILTFIVLGCSGCYRDLSDNLETSPILLTSEQMITAVVTSTVHVNTPTAQPTRTPTVTLTETLIPKVTRHKVNICRDKGRIRVGEGISGTIWYQTYPSDYGPSYFAGGTPPESKPFPISKVEEHRLLGFSPDEQWLLVHPIEAAVFEPKYVMKTLDLLLISIKNEMILIEMDLSPFQDELPADASFYSVEASWINNRLLYVNLWAKSPILRDGVGYYPNLLKVLDPFEGQWVLNYTDELPEGGIRNLSFSLDLERVLYFVPPARLVLWDTKDQRMLWESNDFPGERYRELLWSPDGSFAAIAGSGIQDADFSSLVLTREGEIVQHIADGQYPERKPFLSDARWSPNGRYLALSILGGPDTNRIHQIYIYDGEEKNYLFHCPVIGGSYVIWSPDSRYLALGNESSPILILNIEEESVMDTGLRGFPRAWSTREIEK